MRILQVVHWFLPRHTAGSEVYTYQLAQALSKRHDVGIYCREEGHPEAIFHEEDETCDGLPVHRVYYNPPPGPAYLIRKALARFRNPHIEQSFIRYLDTIQPDIVHFQHLFKLSAALIGLARARGIPTVVTLHDYWFLCDNGQLWRPGMRVCGGPQGGLRCSRCAQVLLPASLHSWITPFLLPLFLYRTWFLRRSLQQADAIISPSSYLRDVFVSHGFSAERIRLSDNGIDVSWRSGVLSIPSPRLRFGYIGTIAPHKGLHVLIEAFNRLNTGRAELRIYGDTTTDPAYTASLHKLSYRETIRFMGPFPHLEIGRVLSEIDVLVVPSLWPENSPLTIHEARTAGVPVLASAIGGIPELVSEGRAGWLFPAGDVAELQRQMASLLEAPEILERARGKMRPVKTIEKNAQELEALYAELVSRSGKAFLSLTPTRG